MNRSERRNLDRALRKLMRKDGDHCTVCRADLPHNSRTYYGRAAGVAAIVGECCRPNLTVEIALGTWSVAPLLSHTAGATGLPLGTLRRRLARPPGADTLGVRPE